MVVLQPLATALVRRLAPLGVDPLALVTLHSAMGLLATCWIATAAPEMGAATSAGWLAAAALLAMKALLDNVDGGLARATGRVTQMGRYYDTGMDLIINVAIFAALATHVGGWPALAGFVASMLVLSLDFNMERRYREARADAPAPARSASGASASGGSASEPPRGAPAPLYRLFEGLYRTVLAPQDRAIERADAALFRVASGTGYDAALASDRRAWSDLFSTATVVDLGLSTQTLVLAALLVIGRPELFPWLCIAGLAWALSVQVRRVGRFRAYRRAKEASLP